MPAQSRTNELKLHVYDHPRLNNIDRICPVIVATMAYGSLRWIGVSDD